MAREEPLAELGELTASNYRKIMQSALRARWGRGLGPQQVWHHMSAEQREDAWLAAAAALIESQDPEVAQRRSLAWGQAVLSLARTLATRREEP